ncbi:hypothetical protein AB0F17_52705 [Nonomuraea sp. NPDC026600]|uniref:hypothetical protein n=1 Tax=Nonomuraea sp. NPDC026600 TaxID=3155363 RepID=UPI0033F53326
MRLALLGYFDVGVSWGVEDAAFRSERAAAQPDIGMVGLRYPLGQGLVVELLTQEPALIGRWRAAARRQLLRPEMETDWDVNLGMSRDEFHRGLAHHISTHPVSRCELTIYAVGTVLAHLEFEPGIPRLFLKGMSQCFEFAAYVPSISLALLGMARDHATAAVDQDNLLAELSRRPPPRTETDADGYTESTLFTSFTDVIACIDEGDDRLLVELLAARGIDAGKAIEFEYHGKLHYDWATCVLEPKTLYGWVPAESPADQIARMFACVQMAHVFLATSEIFVKLFLDETQRQVGGYVTGRVSGRSARDLNRLRTLALAVVNLTDFTLVTQSAEDQTYFKAFARDASLDNQRKLITEACEMLYNIQAEDRDVSPSGPTADRLVSPGSGSRDDLISLSAGISQHLGGFFFGCETGSVELAHRFGRASLGVRRALLSLRDRTFAGMNICPNASTTNRSPPGLATG